MRYTLLARARRESLSMCGSLWLSRPGDSGRHSCAAMKRPSTLLKKPASKTAQAQKKPASPSTRVSNGRSFVVRRTKSLPAAVVSAEENSPGRRSLARTSPRPLSARPQWSLT